MNPTARKSILENIEKSREEFLDFLEGLEIEAYHLPIPSMKNPDSSTWSIVDILVHISRWEAELVKLLWQVKQGQQPTASPFFLSPAKVNEINHIWHRESQGRSVEDVFDDLHAVRNQTLLRLEAFDDKDLFDKNRFPWMRGKSLGEIVSENTFEHEIEHLATIKVWKGPRP